MSGSVIALLAVVAALALALAVSARRSASARWHRVPVRVLRLADRRPGRNVRVRYEPPPGSIAPAPGTRLPQ